MLAPAGMTRRARSHRGVAIVQYARSRFRPPPDPLPLAMTMGALGVVYGDIGTSPLYALKEAAKAAAHGATVTPMPFWALPR